MVNDGSLESLTENLLEYFDGSFIREYSRLIKQQNIHVYRNFIRAKLDNMRAGQGLEHDIQNFMNVILEEDGRQV